MTLHQEVDQVPEGRVVAIGVVALIISVILVGIAWTMAGPPTLIAREAVPAEIGATELSLFPYAPGQETRAEQQRELDRYGWVDRDRGLVHIPIDRAMTLYVEARREER